MRTTSIDGTMRLTPEQQDTVEFIKKNRRILIVDDVGTGKTAPTLCAMHEITAGRALILVKKSCLFQWEQEAQDWLGIKLERFKSSQPIPASQYVLTNVDAVSFNDGLLNTRWDTIIVDEASVYKNRKVPRTANFFRLARRCKNLILLTGTPIHNHPGDIWALLHAIDHRTFKSYWRYVDEYCTTKDNPFSGSRDVEGFIDIDKFFADMRQYILKHAYAGLGLDEPTYENVRLQMTDYQRKQYVNMLKQSIIELDGQVTAALQPITKAMRLRQILLTPALLGGKLDSCKIEALKDILSVHGDDHKIIMFTRYAQFADIVSAHFKIPKLTGALSAKQRQEVLTDFKDNDNTRAIIITQGAGGEGLNLQVADRIVFTDLPDTTKDFYQCVGRAQRRGQTNHVHVWNLHVPYSEDVRDLYRLRGKQDVVSTFNLIAELRKELEYYGKKWNR